MIAYDVAKRRMGEVAVFSAKRNFEESVCRRTRSYRGRLGGLRELRAPHDVIGMTDGNSSEVRTAKEKQDLTARKRKT